jgi:hypothetical protein
MDHFQFDRLTRTIATATSRRKLLSGLAATFITAWFGESTRERVDAKDKGKSNGNNKGKDKPKPEKPGQGDGGGGGNTKVALCHNGHTIEVARPAVQAHLDHGDSLGPCPATETGTEAEPEPSVAQVAGFRVSVACTYSAEQNQSTCTCSAVADSGSEASNLSLLVPAAEVCSDVVGGEFIEIATPSNDQQAGYRSRENHSQVTVVLSGRVTTGGTASYWCSTEAGLIPAPGPGLVCEQSGQESAVPATVTPESEISDSTGAIIVEAYSCAGMDSTPTTSSRWYDRCVTPDSHLTFKLTAGSGTPVAAGLTTETDVNGRAEFPRLPPGSYTLDAVGAHWCHAESDDVDHEGNLLVRAGAYCHVWIFFCESPTGS